MGTRHLVCVVKDGEFRVAQYGQWDGYPSGQGETIVGFLTSLDAAGLALFKEKVAKTKAITGDEVQARWKAVGADDSGFVGMDIAETFKRKNYHLSRDCGADILEYILEAPEPEVYLQTDFAADGLFCEWAYVIDLDADTLEVYKGFNQSPLDPSERFAFLIPKARGEYGPIRLLKRYQFADLTDQTMADLEKEPEEE